ncbi:MAG: hypothetical protein WEC00_00860 [Dongiaceae bacterium]
MIEHTSLVDWLAALLTPVIGVIAIYVAWQQWKLNKRRLKLDLFDKRCEVYKAVKELHSNIIVHGYASEEIIGKFQLTTIDCVFLLDQRLDVSMQSLTKKALELLSMEEESKALLPGEERQQQIQVKHKRRREIMNSLDNAKKLFLPFLQIDK